MTNSTDGLSFNSHAIFSCAVLARTRSCNSYLQDVPILLPGRAAVWEAGAAHSLTLHLCLRLSFRARCSVLPPTGFLLLSLLCSFPKSDLKSPTCLHCGPLAGVLRTTHARMRRCAGFSTELGTSLHLLPGTLTPCLLEPHAGIPAESLHRLWPLGLLAGSSSAAQDSIPARQGQLLPTHLVSEPGPGPGDEERARVGLPVVKEGMRKTRRGRCRPVGTGEPRAAPASSTARMTSCTPGGQARGAAGTTPASLPSHETSQGSGGYTGLCRGQPRGKRSSTPTPCLRFSGGPPFIARFSLSFLPGGHKTLPSEYNLSLDRTAYIRNKQKWWGSESLACAGFPRNPEMSH